MLPARYIETFASLPTKSAGMRIACQSAAGWIPDNDWLSRFFGQTTGERITVDPTMKQQWLNGADIRPEIDGISKGSLVLVLDENGVFLGCGRVSGERIRNFNK